MNRDRFLAKSLADNLEGTRAGLIKLVEILDKHNEGVIVVPKIQHIKISILATVLGKDLSKQLIDNREISFNDGKKIHLCSQATLKNYKFYSAYLVLWGSKESIEKIESLHSWKSAILVTWSPEDSKQWELDHEVTIIYDEK